jgi:hypothetical protein
MNLNMQSTPTAAASHAAFVACQAARDALKMGATMEQAEAARDRAYTDALQG